MLLLFILCSPGVCASWGLGAPPERDLTSASLCCRAEPVLSRIQENRKRVILPSIDNIKQDTFEVQRYENSAHGYSWELWCMYISPPKDWWDAGDPSLPIRSVAGKLLVAFRPQIPGTQEPLGEGVSEGPPGADPHTKAALGIEGILSAWFSRILHFLHFAALAQVFRGRASNSNTERLK